MKSLLFILVHFFYFSQYVKNRFSKNTIFQKACMTVNLFSIEKYILKKSTNVYTQICIIDEKKPRKTMHRTLLLYESVNLIHDVSINPTSDDLILLHIAL